MNEEEIDLENCEEIISLIQDLNFKITLLELGQNKAEYGLDYIITIYNNLIAIQSLLNGVDLRVSTIQEEMRKLLESSFD